MSIVAMLCGAGAGVGADQPNMALTHSEELRFFSSGSADGFRLRGIVLCAEGISPVLEEIAITGEAATGTWSSSSSQFIQISDQEWWFDIDFTTDGQVGSQECIQFGVDFTTGEYSAICDISRCWMLDEVPVSPEPLGLTENSLDVMGILRPGLQTLRIGNHSPGTVSVVSLELAVASGRIPLADLSATGLGTPGDPSPGYPELDWETVTDIPPELPRDAYFDVFLEDWSIDVPWGEFLLVRTQQSTAGDRLDGGYFWVQHQANPDPSGIAGDPPPSASRVRLTGGPVPSRSATTISYELAAPAAIDLRIHDAHGRLVRVLERTTRAPAGRHRIVWDGRDGANRPVAAGVYFCRLATRGGIEICPLVRLK